MLDPERLAERGHRIAVEVFPTLHHSNVHVRTYLLTFFTKHWVMSHDSAKHKQNGVNYIRSESSNRLVPVALYGQVIVWS